jgi:hypothetical protein
MLELIQKLYQSTCGLEDDYDFETIKDPNFMIGVISIEQQFDQYYSFFHQMIKPLAEKGMFKELFLRIDYGHSY